MRALLARSVAPAFRRQLTSVFSMSGSDDVPDRVPADIAARLTARAAEIDAADADNVSVAELRTAAIEAGIGAEAFDAAVAESRAQASLTAHRPWWARLCLAGMVDRRAAVVAYWTWSIGLFAAPALVFAL